jgi:hypothetical protein
MDYHQRVVRQEPELAAQLREVAERLAGGIIETNGSFVVSKDCGTWVAFKR